MPLDAKRKVHQIRGSDDINEYEECYLMRATGELFTDYDEYLTALLDYQARRWTCSISGKAKLTFEEAQLSERTAQRKVDVNFPEVFLEPLCRMVHMSQRRMDELVECLFKRLSCFHNGEEVEWVQSDGREALLVHVLRPVGVDPEFLSDQDPDAALPSKYIVTTGAIKSRTDLNASGSGCEDHAADGADGGDEDDEELEELELACDVLRRPKHRAISRMTIRNKLKVVGNRENYHQAPFLCVDTFVRKFGLLADLPPHLRRLKLNNDAKTGKINKEELAALDPGLAEERAKKRQRKSGGKGESDPQKLVKSVLKTAVQKRVWEATAAAVRKVSDDADDLGLHEIVAALYTDWSTGDMSHVADAGGPEISPEEFVVAAHATLSDLMTLWPESEGPLLAGVFGAVSSRLA
jgi:hypothetical protein